jgi:hypothetical protein
MEARSDEAGPGGVGAPHVVEQIMSKHKPTQWHPIFAELLRPMLQDYYDVQTNVPVGDAPREADILLLRRTSEQPTPFRGLWRHLTIWNVLEFKGPSVSARLDDLSLLVELGLGIHRRLNDERRRLRQPHVGPADASFWYVVRTMGRRFLAGAKQRLGQLEEIETGLWRSQVLQHLVFLVDSETFASEPDSVPLHLLLNRSVEKERELAKIVVERPHYLEWYGFLLDTMHPAAWKEVSQMARTKLKGLKLDFSGIKDHIDSTQLVSTNLLRLVDALGIERVMEAIGPKKMIDAMGLDWFLANLPPAELKKLKERLK